MSDFKEGNEQPEGSSGENPSIKTESSQEAPASAVNENPQATMHAEIEEWRARVAYLAAEVENMRKRFAREKVEIIKLANEELLKKLLPVFDNLELATKAARNQMSRLEGQLKDSPVVDNLVKGVEMTFKHFEQTLESVGVKAVKSVGEVFNPSVHEAVSQSQDPQKPQNSVLDEFQKGFDFQGKLLRPARVVVNSFLQAMKGNNTTTSTSEKETPSSN
jgi:molecular chaperone GrpE